MPVSFDLDGRPISLREYVEGGRAVASFDSLNDDQRAELAAKRIFMQPAYEMGTIGAGVVSKEAQPWMKSERGPSWGEGWCKLRCASSYFSSTKPRSPLTRGANRHGQEGGEERANEHGPRAHCGSRFQLGAGYVGGLPISGESRLSAPCRQGILHRQVSRPHGQAHLRRAEDQATGRCLHHRSGAQGVHRPLPATTTTWFSRSATIPRPSLAGRSCISRPVRRLRISGPTS